MAKRKVTIKDIVEMKRENERLQQIVNHLRIENSDYALKCNRIENIITRIESVVEDKRAELVEASGNVFSITSILQTFMSSRTAVNQPATVTNEASIERRNSVKSRQSSTKTRPNNKAHVKPHMVNGHILFVPTINLTRVSDSHTRGQMEVDSNAVEQDRLEGSSNEGGGDISSSSDTEESETNNENEESSNDKNNTEDMPQSSTSKSPSHLALLSGTFKEVKIYLNPVPQEMLDNSLKSKTKSPKARTTRSGRIIRSKRS